MPHGTPWNSGKPEKVAPVSKKLMRILRYRGNSYASPEPINAAPRPGARSYRWVKYAIETNKVVPLRQRESSASNDHLAD